MSFESEFFGPGNRLRWEAIESGTLTPDVQLRLRAIHRGSEATPDVLVLPRVREDSTVCWLVLCRSGRVARVARDEVRAFLGPTSSDFEIRSEVIDPADPSGAAVLRGMEGTRSDLKFPSAASSTLRVSDWDCSCASVVNVQGDTLTVFVLPAGF